MPVTNAISCGGRPIAATAIADGVAANTAMKLALAVSFGSRRFQTIAGGALALMLAAIGGAFLCGR